MSNLVIEWERLKRERIKAEQWNELPAGRRYENSRFNISIEHCVKPTLTRAGQQDAGANNYWKTREGLNMAILEYIVDGWEDHYPFILQRMKKKESDALEACQSFVDNMQRSINGATENKKPTQTDE